MSPNIKLPDPLTYNVADTMKAICIGRTFLYRLAGAGVLQPRKIGKKTVFLVSEVQEYVAMLPRADIQPDSQRQPMGDAGNNGRLGMSGRRLERLLPISRQTGTRALTALVKKGFLQVVTPSGFSNKTRRATEYRLTWHKCDVTDHLPLKPFMRWKEKQNTASLDNQHGLTTTPEPA